MRGKKQSIINKITNKIYVQQRPTFHGVIISVFFFSLNIVSLFTFSFIPSPRTM